MKKLGVVLLILGLLVAAAGFGVQYVVENHEKVKDLDAILTLIDQDELSPELAMDLLEGKYDVGPITVQSLVERFAPDDAELIMLGLKVYANTPLIIKGGLGVAVLGLLLALVAPSKKKKARSGYSYGA